MQDEYAQNPFKGIIPTDEIDFGELIEVIKRSELSEGKKIAYLYMIAEETFTLADLEEIENEMIMAGRELEKEQGKQMKKLQELKAKEAKLREKVAKAQVKSAREMERNFSKLEDAMLEEANASQLEKVYQKLTR
ncbi:MAG: hypothetical protein Q8O95_02070 [bacterium]|nr:hypothetical protein [bacterium]